MIVGLSKHLKTMHTFDSILLAPPDPKISLALLTRLTLSVVRPAHIFNILTSVTVHISASLLSPTAVHKVLHSKYLNDRQFFAEAINYRLQLRLSRTSLSCRGLFTKIVLQQLEHYNGGHPSHLISFPVQQAPDRRTSEGGSVFITPEFAPASRHSTGEPRQTYPTSPAPIPRPYLSELGEIVHAPSPSSSSGSSTDTYRRGGSREDDSRRRDS
jgi:hypothetical protein